MLAEEAQHLFPAVHGSLDIVAGTVYGEEAVSRAVIAVELIVLAVLLEGLLRLVHVGGRWAGVVVSEQAQQRQFSPSVKSTGQAGIAGVSWSLPGSRRRPAVHRRVHALKGAGAQVGLPPAGAEADQPHLAVQVGQRAEIGHRPSTSPMVRTSGIPPFSRMLALFSCGVALPSRKCRLGEMVTNPL